MTDEDRKAIDLLLDRVPATAGKPQEAVYFSSTDANLRQKVADVERVLNLLDAMPAAEPPANLLERTLSFVQSASREQVTGQRQGQFNQPPIV